MKKTLLVVDDEKPLREVLEMSFRCLGYEVYTADNGLEGEVLARRILPSCIILDVMMPHKNGYTVCNELKRDPATDQIPIILLTAKSLKDDVYWGYDCGADAYVTKPYDPRVLEALVERLVADAEQGRRTVAWTGLPDASGILQEAAKRREAGEPYCLVELSFLDGPRETFTQKYGQIRYRDLVHATGWRVYEVVREKTAAGQVGQRRDESFVLLVHTSEAARVKESIERATPATIDSFYGPKEREAGGIIPPAGIVKDLPGGASRLIPLMRLQWNIAAPSGG